MKKYLIGAVFLLSLLQLALPSNTAADDLSTTACPGVGCQTINTANAASIGIQVTGTWVGTLTFQGSVDNTNYVSILVAPSTSTTAVTTTTGNGTWLASVSGLSTVRVVFTSYMSGTAVVTVRATTLAHRGGGSSGGGGGSGSVTSVGLALPTSVFDISGSPVTTSGTLTATFDTQTANTVFAGPTTGVAATPTFRALVTSDLPSGSITGSLAATQIGFGSGTNTIAGSSAFTWTTASNLLTLTAGEIYQTGPAAGTELTTNGTFTGSATGWTLGTGWAYSANTVVHTPGNTAALAQATVVPVSGVTYLIRVITTAGTNGALTIALGGDEDFIYVPESGNGTFDFLLTAVSAATLTLTPDTDYDGTITSVSVKQQDASLIINPNNVLTGVFGPAGFKIDGLGQITDNVVLAALTDNQNNRGAITLYTEYQGGYYDKGVGLFFEHNMTGSSKPNDIYGSWLRTKSAVNSQSLVSIRMDSLLSTGVVSGYTAAGGFFVSELTGANTPLATGAYVSVYDKTGAAGVTTFASYWSDDVRGSATNPYFLWFNGGPGTDCDKAGVYRVNDFGISAYYNPCFAIYTAGSSNFERIISRWGDTGVFGADNRAYLGVEVGGTGTARALNIIGANVSITSTLTPAVSDTSANSCGTGTQTIVGNDNAGKVTVIGSVGTSCTVTFATAFTNAPSCTVTNETTAALVRATSATGTVILAGTFAQNDVLAYICIGR